MNIPSNHARSSLLRSALATGVNYCPAACVAAVAVLQSVSAANLYWDTNDTAAGSGNASGDWDTATANWNATADGTGTAQVWTDAETAVFSAGTDGTNFTATVTGTVAPAGIVFEQAGGVTLTGGTITVGGTTIDSSVLGAGTNQNIVIGSELAGSGGLTIASHGSLAASGGGSNSELDLAGTNTFTGDLTITSGLVSWTTDAAFGDVANKIVLNGGGLLDPNRALNLSRDLELTGNGVYRVYGSVNSTITGNISGSGNLTKTDGGGLFIESTGNTFTGRTIVQGGGLRIAGDSSLGAAPATATPDALTLENGTRLTGGTGAGGADITISANRGITLASGDSGFNTLTGFTTTVDSGIVGAGRLTSNFGSLVVNGDTDLSNGLFIAAGEATFNGDLDLTGAIRVQGASTLNINSTNATADGGFDLGTGTTNINLGSGAGGTMIIDDWELGQGGGQPHTSNLLAGDVRGSTDVRIGHWGGSTSSLNISGGSLSLPDTVTSPTNEGQANVFLGIDGEGSLSISGGTLNATSIVLDGRGSSGSPGSHVLSLTGGSLNVGQWGIRNGGANYLIEFGGGVVGTTSSSAEPGYDWSSDWSTNLPITLTGTGGDTSFDAGAHTITLGGDLSGAGGFSLDGGNLVLTGTGSYLGSTVVNGGSLFLNGAASGTSPVTVNTGGTLFLDGTGTSDVTIEAGGVLRVGTAALTGLASIPTLDLQAGSSSTFRLDFFNPDEITIAGTNGFSTTGTHSITAIPSGELFVGDNFPLFKYDGTIQGAGFAGLAINPLPNPHIGVILIDNTTDSQVEMEVTAIDTLTWTGDAGNGNWDVNTSQNWVLDSDGTTPSNFYEFDSVTFEDGSGQTNLTLTGPITTAGITFNNNVDTFTLAGDGISAGPLTLDGNGAVQLLNANTYVEPTVINGGTLIVGNGTTGNLSASSNVSVAAGGALELNLNPATPFASPIALNDGFLRLLSDQTVSSPITSTVAGEIEVNSPNTLTTTGVLSGTTTKTGDGSLVANNTTGTFTVLDGDARVTGRSGNNDFVVDALDGTLVLDFTQASNYSNGVTVLGDGVASPNGFFMGSGRNINFQRNGGLRLTTDSTTIRTSDGGTSTLSGFDINSVHLTVESAASGSIIASDVNINSGGFGYRMNVASGLETATGDIVIDSVISGAGSVGRANIQVNVWKTGDGSARLNGSNTFTEGLFLRDGSVILGGDERIADTAGIAFGEGGLSGTLVLNGFTETVSDLGVNGGTANMIVGGSATSSALIVDYNGTDRSFGGTIGGSGDDANLSFTKSGTGRFELTSALSYTGTTSVTAGTLSLATDTLDDAAEVNLSGTGVLELTHASVDAIGSLVIGGVTQADGTYGATGSGATNVDDTRFSGTGVLLVGDAAPYDAYETANNIVGAGPDVDSDGDGIANGIEFVIGGVSDPGVGQSDLDKLPTATTDATNLVFVFRRTDDSAGSNPYVEYGSDLTGWTEAEGGVGGVTIFVDDDAIAAGIDEVTVTIPRSLIGTTTGFARLRVDILPPPPAS